MSSELFSGSENARIDEIGAAVLPSNYGSAPRVTVVDARSVNGNLGCSVYIMCVPALVITGLPKYRNTRNPRNPLRKS